MSDLVARLKVLDEAQRPHDMHKQPIFAESADEIARLTAENERMRKAIWLEHERLISLADRAAKRCQNDKAYEFYERAKKIDFGRPTANSGSPHAAQTHSSAQTKCEICGEDIGHKNHRFDGRTAGNSRTKS